MGICIFSYIPRAYSAYLDIILRIGAFRGINADVSGRICALCYRGMTNNFPKCDDLVINQREYGLSLFAVELNDRC